MILLNVFTACATLLGGKPYILALADRAGGPQLLERGDKIGYLRIGVDRRRREAHALRSARYGRIIDGLHVDSIMVEQGIGDRLAVHWIAHHYWHDMARIFHDRQAGVAHECL